MVEHLQNTLPVTSPFMEGGDLYEKIKAFWLFGDWQHLIELTPEQYNSHAERAKISLLIGSAHLQLNNLNQAEQHIKCAYQWQIDHKLAARILIAGTNNTLGRIAALNEDAAAAQTYFEKSLDVGINNSDLVAHSRAVRETASLGLLPQAAQLVSSKLYQYENNLSQIKDQQAHLDILKIELELLNHELSLSQQKQQLYHLHTEHDMETQVIGSPEYIERLKRLSPSQLGQDLWVLEKTNYKKDGFFVEFGATDGVLLSNTYLLEKQFGWQGICAEPNPKFFNALKNNRRCRVSDACIAKIGGETVEFILAEEYGSLVSYADKDMHSSKRQAYLNKNSTITLTTTTLDQLLDQHNAPKVIDYLSIDTEGNEYEILESFDFKKWDIMCISVEHNFTENRNKIFNLLTKHGYKRTESQFDDWYSKI